MIAVLSVLGLWRPISFSPILLVQLIYKGTWLVIVALPAIKNDQPYPSGMATFFLVWVWHYHLLFLGQHGQNKILKKVQQETAFYLTKCQLSSSHKSFTE